ncbi:MAG TPA: SAM-dependent chlorinase/fluorinase [Myxococcota bacterium]|nr:SAM-dependent chlorinase/fluorinase [Myxococcota bacterium]
MSASGIVTLTTDFGAADGYLGEMKGVLLSRCRGAVLVDLAHDLAPGDVRAAAFLLARAAPLFPAGTVHLAVVDPGVGTARRELALRCGEQLFVGPDNGSFAAVAVARGVAAAHALANRALFRAEVSPVFHGRDIFAPVAAHLAAGGALADVGPALAPESLVGLDLPEVVESDGALRGEVIHIDRFGNLVTNLAAPRDRAGATVELADRRLALARTYGDVQPGGLVALVGSSGRIEIAANGASAAAVLGARAGLVVILRAPRESA